MASGLVDRHAIQSLALSGKAPTVRDLLAVVAGENEQAIEGQFAFAAVRAGVPWLGLGMGTLCLIWFAPPETAVSPTFFIFFCCLAHLLFPEPDMSDARCNWQVSIWLGIMPRSMT